jgi:hypothetical protein
LADIGEYGLRLAPPVAVRTFADATQPWRLQLDRGKLRIGVVAQSGKQRKRSMFDNLIIRVQRVRAFRSAPPHSVCCLRINQPRIMA